MLPMMVAPYLYLVMLMPAASAVAGFSPTARRCRPTRVWLSTKLERIARAMARYARKP